jgi:histone H3/H4
MALKHAHKKATVLGGRANFNVGSISTTAMEAFAITLGLKNADCIEYDLEDTPTISKVPHATVEDCLEYEDIDFKYDLLAIITMMQDEDSVFNGLEAGSALATMMERFFCEPFSSVKVEPAAVITSMATKISGNDMFSSPTKVQKVETFYSKLQQELKDKCGFILANMNPKSANKLNGSALDNVYKWRDCKEFIIRKALQSPLLPEQYRHSLITQRKFLFQKILIEGDEDATENFVQDCLKVHSDGSVRVNIDGPTTVAHPSIRSNQQSILRSISKASLRKICRRAGCPFDDKGVGSLFRQHIHKLLDHTLSQTSHLMGGGQVVSTDSLLSFIDSPRNCVKEPKSIWGFGAKNGTRYLLVPSLIRMIKNNYNMKVEGTTLSCLHDMLVQIIQSFLDFALENPTNPERNFKFEKLNRRSQDYGLQVNAWVANGTADGGNNDIQQPTIDYRAIMAALPFIFQGQQLSRLALKAVSQALLLYAGLPSNSAFSFEQIVSHKFDANDSFCGSNKSVFWICPDIIALVCERLHPAVGRGLTFDAIIAISSIVEYLAMEIFEGCVHQLNAMDTTVLAPIHIQRSLHNDEDLLELFPGHCRLSAVIEHVHKSFLHLPTEPPSSAEIEVFTSRINQAAACMLRNQAEVSIHPIDGSFVVIDSNGLLTPMPGIEMFSTLSCSEMYDALSNKLNEADRLLVRASNRDPFSAKSRRLLEMKETQRSTVLSINRLLFQRLVIDIGRTYGLLQFTNEAVELLQVFVEEYLLSWTECAVRLAVSANRKIVIVEDFDRALSSRNEEFFIDMQPPSGDSSDYDKNYYESDIDEMQGEDGEEDD